MKKILLMMAFAVISLTAYSQDIFGTWITESGDGNVEIYENNGKIYDPKSGKTYKCTIWLDGKNLKVRGILGIFHSTQTWKRK